MYFRRVCGVSNVINISRCVTRILPVLPRGWAAVVSCHGFWWSAAHLWPLTPSSLASPADKAHAKRFVVSLSLYR